MKRILLAILAVSALNVAAVNAAPKKKQQRQEDAAYLAAQQVAQQVAQQQEMLAQMQKAARVSDKVDFLRDRGVIEIPKPGTSETVTITKTGTTEAALDAIIADYNAKGAWLQDRNVAVNNSMSMAQLDGYIAQYTAGENVRIDQAMDNELAALNLAQAALFNEMDTTFTAMAQDENFQHKAIISALASRSEAVKTEALDAAAEELAEAQVRYDRAQEALNKAMDDRDAVAAGEGTLVSALDLEIERLQAETAILAAQRDEKQSFVTSLRNAFGDLLRRMPSMPSVKGWFSKAK